MPIDAAPESEQALAMATGLARAAGANVALLHVATPTPVPTWAFEWSAHFEFEEFADPGAVNRPRSPKRGGT